MNSAPVAGAPTRRLRVQGLERRLVQLMAARLVLALCSLGVALVLDAAVANFEFTDRRGFYATVAAAFLATAVYGVLLPYVRRPKLFAVLNIVTDIGVVSSFVYLSGGAQSPFVFLSLRVGV